MFLEMNSTEKDIKGNPQQRSVTWSNNTKKYLVGRDVAGQGPANAIENKNW